MGSGGDHLLLGERDGVKEGLHWGLAKAPAALMRPVLVVAPDPLIKIGLQFGDRAVDPLAERDPVELVQHRLMEALNDAVGLWAFGLGAGVIHILNRQIELVLVPLGLRQYSVPRSVSTRDSFTS